MDSKVVNVSLEPLGFQYEAGYGSSAAEVVELDHVGDDVLDMDRMGRAQEFVRSLKFASSVSFIMIATGSGFLIMLCVIILPGTVLLDLPLPTTFSSMTQGLIDGGKAGLMWSYIWNAILFLPINMSLAEMASMAPTAGGQYHWVSEFAPFRWQKGLSYFTGWMSTLAWQSGNATGVFLTGLLLQTIIFLNDEGYAMPRWHGSLLSIAIACLVLPATTFGAKYIPKVQNILFILSLGLYVGIIVPIWISAPKSSVRSVFLDFENLGGWQNMTLAIFVGQLMGISNGTGYDTAAHMAEEVKDAGKNVPRSIVAAYCFSCCITFFLVLTLCFGMPDLEAALNDPTEYPSIYVLRQSMSNGAVTTVIALICALLTASNVSYLTAVSRDLYAFARDNGLPFAKWIATVDKKRHVPINAIIVSSVISVLMSLIYIGSSTAYYAIVSLFLIAILQCYMFSIASVLWRRIFLPETLPPARWSLGRAGIPINTISLIYNIWAFFWVTWPQFNPVTAETFNWASVIFLTVSVASGVLYIWKHKVYHGPVVLVKDREDVFRS